jgi:hypothetical protein
MTGWRSRGFWLIDETSIVFLVVPTMAKIRNILQLSPNPSLLKRGEAESGVSFSCYSHGNGGFQA